MRVSEGGDGGLSDKLTLNKNHWRDISGPAHLRKRLQIVIRVSCTLAVIESGSVQSRE